MNRWIDADHLRKWILSWWERTEPTSEFLKGGDILNQIDREPSIDIVRCRECRYWHSGECWGIPYRGDYDTSIDTKADDFCSYGEREGE